MATPSVNIAWKHAKDGDTETPEQKAFNRRVREQERARLDYLEKVYGLVYHTIEDCEECQNPVVRMSAYEISCNEYEEYMCKPCMRRHIEYCGECRKTHGSLEHGR